MSKRQGLDEASAWLAVGLGLALVQAAALWALQYALLPSPAPTWLIGALGYVAVAIPFVVVASGGVLRRATFVVWTLTATLAVGAMGAWNALRSASNPFEVDTLPPIGVSAACALAMSLFIAQALVQAGDAERRLIASYPSQVLASWRLATRVLLVGLFSFGIWITLKLGGALFALLGLGPFDDIWPGLPFIVALVSFALAMELCRRRLGFAPQVSGAFMTFSRRLLPVAVVLVAAFFACFALQHFVLSPGGPSAINLLLASAGGFVALVSLAHRDGSRDDKPGPLVRWPARLVAFGAAGLTIAAGVALWPDLFQGAVTPEDVWESAWLAVTAVYAGGYALAALRPGLWMRGIEPINLAGAFAILAAVAALGSPLADPGKIAAGDQLKRLSSGPPASEWIYRLLTYSDYGRFGRDVLNHLAQRRAGPHAAEIARRARIALSGVDRPRTEDLIADIHVHPEGAELPKGFLDQEEVDASLYGCPVEGCDAYLLDIDHDGRPTVLFAGPALATIYKQSPAGAWTQVGHLSLLGCRSEQEALRSGRVRLTDPQRSDIEIGARTYRIQEDGQVCDGDAAPSVLDFVADPAPAAP